MGYVRRWQLKNSFFLMKKKVEDIEEDMRYFI